MNVFSSVANNDVIGLTAREFADNYLKELDFETYSKGLRPQEVKDFVKFFDCLKKGLQMIDRTGEGIDRGGKPYKFYNFIKSKALTGCKIFPIGEWDRMIDDYQDGRLNINFTAEDLANELIND